MQRRGMVDEDMIEASFKYADKKRDHVRKRITSANVVFISCEEGILIITQNRKVDDLKKIFEVHYRIAGAKIGEIGVIDDVGNLIINAADILNGHKLLSGVNDIAKPVSKHLSDVFREFSAPMVFKIMLAEVGDNPQKDKFIEIPCDGYTAVYKYFAILGEENAKNHPGNIYAAATAAFTALYKEKSLQGRSVLISEAMKIVCGLFGEKDPFEAAVLYREKPEWEKNRHFVRLSADKIAEYLK